jgi:hypothetical protein
MADKELNARLRFTQEGVDKTAADVGKLNRNLEETRKAAQKAAEQAEKISYIGMRIGATGASLMAPFLLASRTYLQNAGLAEQTSRRWIAATQDFERAQIRVGRVAAQQVLPLLEKAANLSGKIARLAEEHPELVKAALGVGGTLVAAGAAVAAVGQVAGTIARLQALGLFGTGGKLAAAVPGLGYAAAGLGGVGAGILGAQALGYKGDFGQGLGDIARFGTRTFAAIPLGLIATGLRDIGAISNDTARSLGQTAAAIGNVGQAAEETGQAAAQEQLNRGQAVKLYAEYQKAAQEADKEYEQARVETVQEFGQRRLESEQDYESRRAEAALDFNQDQAEALTDFNRSQNRSERDFLQSVAQAEADYNRDRGQLMRQIMQQEAEAEATYYKERSKRAAEYGIESERAEEDHQRAIARLRQDYQLQQEDAISNRDAIAFLRNQRQYEVQRGRAEEDYQTEQGRRDEDYARQMAELEEAFGEQRAQRQAQAAQQLADQQEQYRLQREQAQAGYDQQRDDAQADFEFQRQRQIDHQNAMLAELDDEHRQELDKIDQQRVDALAKLDQRHAEEKAKLDQAFSDQLLALDGFLSNSLTKWDAFYATMGRKLDEWMFLHAGQLEYQAPGRAAGGYAGAGVYRLGERGREFVLSHATTRRMEQLLPRGLNQGNVLQLATAGAQFSQSVHIGTDGSYAGLLSAIRSQTINLLNEYARG